jgi:hypothetical protein
MRRGLMGVGAAGPSRTGPRVESGR